MGVFRDSRQEESITSVVDKSRLNANYNNFRARLQAGKTFSLPTAIAATKGGLFNRPNLKGYLS